MSNGNQAFFQYGHVDTNLDSTYEDFLVADEAGLRHLRDQIDSILAGQDEVHFSDSDVITDLNGIKIGVLTNSDSERDQEIGFWGKVLAFTLLATIVTIIFMGLMQFFGLIGELIDLLQEWIFK